MKIPALTKTYDQRMVLHTPELELRPGLIYTVIGPNGSGKSTFARILAGVLQSDSPVYVPDRQTAVRYMPQKSYPFRMSIKKNIRLAGADPQRADELTRALNLKDLEHQQVRHLSGGETAKLALIRVLMQSCDLLILDEPTAAMDMESAIAAERMIREYRDSADCAVLLITHDLFQARRMADEVLFFSQGELYEQGLAEEILYHPQKEVTQRFLDYYGKL